MWPDTEDASKAAEADAVPTERFAMMPRWLGFGFWGRGRQGYWNPHLTNGVPQQVAMAAECLVHTTQKRQLQRCIGWTMFLVAMAA